MSGEIYRIALLGVCLGDVAIRGQWKELFLAGQPGNEHLLKGCTLNGLREVVVHTRSHALFAVSLDSGRGHGDDGHFLNTRKTAVGLVAAQGVCSSIAVQDGHLTVHQDERWHEILCRMIGRRICFRSCSKQIFEGLLTIPHCGCCEAEGLEGFQGKLAIDDIVFDDKNMEFLALC